MAYTENLEYLEQRLADYGLDIQAATDAVLSGRDGFGISFADVPQDQIGFLVKQVRTLLYSWLHCLGVKEKYSIKMKRSSVEIALKTPKPNFRGKFVLGTKVGETKMGSRSTVIMKEADSQDWDVMPSEDSTFQEAKLKAAIEGNEDAFVNDGFEEFKHNQSVMSEGYDPKTNIFPVPKEFVTPAGLKDIDDVELD